MANDVGPGTEPEVVGVAENDLGLHEVELFWVEGFDRSLGAHRHKNRGLNDSVWSGEAAAAGLAIRVCLKEFEHGDNRVLTQE